MKLLYVKVSPEALAKICARAERERRRPQDEAGLLIERALAAELAKTKRASEFGQPG